MEPMDSKNVIMRNGVERLHDMLKYRNASSVQIRARMTFGGEDVIITRVDKIAWRVPAKNSTLELECFDENGKGYCIFLRAPGYYHGEGYIAH